MKSADFKTTRSSAVIGARRNPNIQPGGFSAPIGRDTLENPRPKKMTLGMAEVSAAATKWLDRRAVR